MAKCCRQTIVSSLVFAVGRGGWTLWVGFTLWITSLEAPHGSGPPWRRCVTTSSGSTSAVSCREPCNSSTRDLYSGWGNDLFIYYIIWHYYTDLWHSTFHILLFYCILIYVCSFLCYFTFGLLFHFLLLFNCIILFLMWGQTYLYSKTNSNNWKCSR